jgi:hypothetical protein
MDLILLFRHEIPDFHTHPGDQRPAFAGWIL